MGEDNKIWEYMVNTLVQMPAANGEFSPQQVELIKLLIREKKTVFLPFAPKCGGTYLRTAAGKAIGTQTLLRGSFSSGDQERDLYFPHLFAHYRAPQPKLAVLHCHLNPNKANLDLMRLFDLKPTVMTRSIPDMLRSFYDMLIATPQDDPEMNHSGFGSIYYNRNFYKLDENCQKDFLIYNFAPWYIKYFAGWLNVRDQKLLSSGVLFISFREFREQPKEALTKVLAFNGFQLPSENLDAALDLAARNKKALRFNKGLEGRGRAFFSDAHFQHLRVLAKAHPEIDFDEFGLFE